jgi:hypothetical protein
VCSCPPPPPPPSQPDVATRLFLRKLKTSLQIPVLALVDSDPYGLKILSVYMKVGGRAVCVCVCVCVCGGGGGVGGGGGGARQLLGATGAWP